MTLTRIAMNMIPYLAAMYFIARAVLGSGEAAIVNAVIALALVVLCIDQTLCVIGLDLVKPNRCRCKCMGPDSGTETKETP